MKVWAIILIFFLLMSNRSAAAPGGKIKMKFFGDWVEMPAPPPYKPFPPFSGSNVKLFISSLAAEELQPYLNVLLTYKQAHQLDDWLYYQLVWQVAGLLSPKGDNYYRYTVYKWWSLVNSGYDARLTYSGSYLLFYVKSKENVYNIPYHLINGEQYVCLNYHDYDEIDFNKNRFEEIGLANPLNTKPFSYRVNRMPDFDSSSYVDKSFNYDDGFSSYDFHIKVNPQIKQLFTNYPVVDYDIQFNIPLSKTSYQSLLPEMKQHVKKMKQKDGIDFLMNFTRYAFLFKSDTEVFGTEKRLSPEQTLLYEYSDCEERSALFYYLVKEIYDLPMLVLVYPKHVTVAVQLTKLRGNTIDYNGAKYSICEPSPQRYNLLIGQQLPETKKQPFEIAYAYHPAQH